MLTPTFQSLPSFHLAGIRRWHTFATAPETIPPQWNEFNALSLPGRAEAKVSYGATCQMDMPNQRFEYISGYEVPSFDNLPFRHRPHDRPRRRVRRVLSRHRERHPPLLAVCLPDLATLLRPKAAHTPDFERYDHLFDPVTRGPLEIWFPIAR